MEGDAHRLLEREGGRGCGLASPPGAEPQLTVHQLGIVTGAKSGRLPFASAKSSQVMLFGSAGLPCLAPRAAPSPKCGSVECC